MKLGDFKRQLPNENQLSDLNSRIDGLMMVLDLVKKMNADASKRDILKTIIQYAMEVSKCSRGAILIQENEDLDFKIGLNLNNDVISESEFNISYSVCNDVLKSGKSMFIEEAQGEGYKATESIVALNLRTIFCAPLIYDKIIFGVLYVDSTNLGSKNLSTIGEFFEIFAEHASITLSNANKFSP